MSKTPEKKVIPIEVVDTDDVTLSLYEASRKIYPRSTKGVFTNWRWLMVFLTQIVFYGLPWLQWNGRQAVLFDIAHRRFYLFESVLYPQDLIFLTGLLIVSALSLFLFTAVAGRLWCGFTCPQTVYTEIFLWIESKVEGDRAARIRLDKNGNLVTKITKKTTKHFLWIAFSLWTGFTFVGFFSPIRDLAESVMLFQLGPWEGFWVFFYGFATYGNAGFMREQVCKYMCPYARFQSAMFDKDTLIVTYDSERGEPRGPRSSKVDPKEKGLGSCIDCKLCVHVCPTGIDIREGLQYECISCGACIDVCDDVMKKMGYEPGLVKMTTQNGMINKWSAKTIWKRIFRPRVLIYSSILWILVGVLMFSMYSRSEVRFDVVRDRASLGRIVAGGKLENVYQIQVMNTTEQTETYSVSATGVDGITVNPPVEIEVGPAGNQRVVVNIQIPYDALPSGSHPIMIHLKGQKTGVKASEKSTFFVPN